MIEKKPAQIHFTTIAESMNAHNKLTTS